jgi:hypothetical protein
MKVISPIAISVGDQKFPIALSLQNVNLRSSLAILAN